MPDQRYRIGRSAWLGAIIAFVLLALGIDRQETMLKERYAILLTVSEAVKEVPDPRAGDTFNLNEGVKVELVEELNGWWKIELPDGRSGWVQPNSWGRI